MLSAAEQLAGTLKPKSWSSLVFRSFVAGLLGAPSINIPILGLLPLLVAAPLFWAFPEFASTGRDVEYTFGMAYLKSPKAWGVYMLYFAAIAAVLGLIDRGINLRRR